MHRVVGSVVWAALVSCGPSPREPFVCDLPTPEEPEQPNVLLVIIDDVGIEQLAPWGVGRDPVHTPTIDCLCDEGVRFQDVWAAPTCTPGRVSLLAGTHPRREGVGRFVNAESSTWEMPLAWRTVGDAAQTVGYATAYVGKWHLGGFYTRSGLDHPNLQGFERFRGTMGNIRHRTLGRADGDYWDWEEVVDGVAQSRTGYLTQATIDDALQMLEELPEPWLLVVSLHGAHSPLHTPPTSLLEDRLSRRATDEDQFRAMVQSVDTEIGRLLDTMDRDVLGRTQMWTVSDNGTPSHGIPAPLDPARSKDTLFEGGVRVPLVVTGPRVPQPGVSPSLVSALDVHATILEVLGSTSESTDGHSLLPLLQEPRLPHRSVLYADRTRGDGEVDRAVRNTTHKLLRRANGRQISFALTGGLDEHAIDEVHAELEISLDRFVDELED
ncbi:MAG: sulfatase-like hydrolase/transferase [Myxococcales bacterium]|nr:sulfatase-like hydrolase/transferase [Myxococcales bacterium]